jgi:hypothetical protein
VGRLRVGKQSRSKVRVGAPDPSLTGVSGMAAVTELCERLDVVGALDGAVGPIKQRARGHSAGQLLVGLAAAQLAGEDFLVGLDRHRADAAGPRPRTGHPSRRPTHSAPATRPPPAHRNPDPAPRPPSSVLTRPYRPRTPRNPAHPRRHSGPWPAPNRTTPERKTPKDQHLKSQIDSSCYSPIRV